MRRGFALAAIVLAAACAHFPVNEKLQQADIAKGYRYANVTLPRDDGLFVIMTFSGGGSRAAGFAYGVLRQIENVRLRDGSRLIDHIDVISSVSGGSFTSMYLGLHGPEGLEDFKKRFLDRDVEGMLFHAAINPVNLVRLASPNFSRIDLAAEVYDKILFDNATYGDLKTAQVNGAAKRPLIIANSTELDLGSRFEWTQDQFDPICSDLSTTHVSRAVAASSAFPVLLTPMVLRNYRGECGYVPPSWVKNARGDMAINPMRAQQAGELEAYLDTRREWLHLMDGGIADNIGLRGPLHAMTSADTLQMDDPARRRTGFTIQGELNRRTIKRLLVITVNAATESDLNFDKREGNPGLAGILGAVAGTPLSNYSFDTVEMLRRVVTEYELRQRQPADCVAAVKDQCPNATLPGADVVPVSFYPVILGFTSIQDRAFRQQLNDIGTNFSLKPGQLDLLERAAKELLAGSEAFQEFLKDAGAR